MTFIWVYENRNAVGESYQFECFRNTQGVTDLRVDISLLRILWTGVKRWIGTFLKRPPYLDFDPPKVGRPKISSHIGEQKSTGKSWKSFQQWTIEWIFNFFENVGVVPTRGRDIDTQVCNTLYRISKRVTPLAWENYETSFCASVMCIGIQKDRILQSLYCFIHLCEITSKQMSN